MSTGHRHAWDSRDLAQWCLRGAVISCGAAVVLSLLFASSPNNPLTQWVPAVITLLWWLGGVVLAVGLVLVGLALTSERFRRQ
jgi:predicted permease